LNTYSIITIIIAPIIIPLLLADPPIMKAAQTRKVVDAGDMKAGDIPVNFHAHKTPARPAMAAPSARLAALFLSTS